MLLQNLKRDIQSVSGWPESSCRFFRKIQRQHFYASMFIYSIVYSPFSSTIFQDWRLFPELLTFLKVISYVDWKSWSSRHRENFTKTWISEILKVQCLVNMAAAHASQAPTIFTNDETRRSFYQLILNLFSESLFLIRPVVSSSLSFDRSSFSIRWLSSNEDHLYGSSSLDIVINDPFFITRR